MKRIVFILILFLHGCLLAQEDARVYFTDKPDAAFYLANPLEMLSQKALDRRGRQGIAPDEQDVPVHQPYVDGVAASAGIIVMAKSKWLNALHVRGTVEDIQALGTLPYVERIEFANKTLNAGRPGATHQPKAVNKTLETMAEYSYGTSESQVKMLNGHLLHEQDYTGTGIIIAVLDAGFPGVDTAEPFQRLIDNNLILGGYDFVARSQEIYTGGTHGTLVLSTMGGYKEGQLVGTAPDAFYYLLRTEDSTSENPVEESYWVEAAETADSLGVDIINTSLGYFEYDNPAYNYSYEDMDGQTAFITRGANVAFTRGMLCVTSAGNSANTWHPNIGAPADAFNTLTVGAVDADEQYGQFSSLGPAADMRVKPDVMAQGVSTVYSDAGGAIAAGNGTSFSSPITAGLVACLWQALPDKTNAEILQLIKESADRYNNPNAQYGYGIPDFALALENARETIVEYENIVLYPNVSDDIVNLIFPEDVEKASVTIFNNLGQIVQQHKVTSASPSFSIASLSTGIYFFRAESKLRAVKGRLVKR